MKPTTSTESPIAASGARINWKAAIWAGLIAGLVFMMAEMIMVAVFQGESPWAPPRMIAAMVLGTGVLESKGFDPTIMMAAMAVHLPLSILYGVILALLLRSANLVTAIMVGSAFGLAIYLINFYPVANAFFPWFAMGRGWINIVTHMMFGAVGALTYFTLRNK